jgi:hypothetical protein
MPRVREVRGVDRRDDAAPGARGSITLMRSSAAGSRIGRTLLASVAAVGLVACGQSQTAPTTTTAAPTADVPESLQFSAPILGGGRLDGSSLAGRAVMLWFWAPT